MSSFNHCCELLWPNASTEGLSEEGCKSQCETTSIGKLELELVLQRTWQHIKDSWVPAEGLATVLVTTGIPIVTYNIHILIDVNYTTRIWGKAVLLKLDMWALCSLTMGSMAGWAWYFVNESMWQPHKNLRLVKDTGRELEGGLCSQVRVIHTIIE